MKKTLIMMCGVPGSGKSTTATRLMKYFDHPCYFSLDQTREEMFGTRAVQAHGGDVWLWTMKKIVNAYFSHDVVIYDATNITPSNRYAVAQYLRKNNLYVDIFCVWLNVPQGLAKERNAMRKPEERVPDRVIKDMNSRFVEPTFKEELEEQQIFKEIYKIYPETLDNSADIVYNILTKQIKEQ